MKEAKKTILLAVLFCMLIPQNARAYIFSDERPATQGAAYLNFLELYAANLASSSGESASSLVNSVRDNGSIYSSQLVEYDEVSSSQTSPLTPGFRYSRKFGEWFAGINYATTNEVTYLRDIYGNDNSYFKDQARTEEQTTGVVVGLGPIDYTTEDSSGEFAFAYTVIRSKGPYSQLFLKSPSFVTAAQIATNPSNSQAALDNYNLVSYSTGQLNYDIETYSLRGGYAFSLNSYFNVYGRMDMDILLGNLNLSTFSVGAATQAISSGAAASLPNANYISYLNARLTGILLRMEAGMVAKLYPGVGLRFGYYGQVPFVNVEIKDSLDTYRSLSNDPFLTSLREPEPTSLSDRKAFLHGAYFAVVANF